MTKVRVVFRGGLHPAVKALSVLVLALLAVLALADLATFKLAFFPVIWVLAITYVSTYRVEVPVPTPPELEHYDPLAEYDAIVSVAGTTEPPSDSGS